MKRRFSHALILFTCLSTFSAAPANAAIKKSKTIPSKPTPLALKIASSAKNVASSMDSVGYCFRGVKRALKVVGIGLKGTSAYQAKRQLQKDERFKQVSMKNLKKGDILVHNRSRKHPHGHIAVYLGDKKEASDNIRKVVSGRNYGGTTVFRPVGDHANDGGSST